jgi:hypothetical protein
MHISGTGIISFDLKIKPEFTPKTTLALTWEQLSNEDYACTDRGATSDKYDVDLRIYKDEATINNFISQIEANRVAGSYVISLSNFNSQEHIFGADLDYSGTINATVDPVNLRVQGTFKGWELTFTLKCLSPTFVGGNGSLPAFRFLDYGYTADSEYSITKFESYAMTSGTRNFSYLDSVSDKGKFTGVYSFSDQEMIGLRRFIATNRGSKFTMPTLIGVAHPFGRRANPTYVKMTDFQDMGMLNLSSGRPRWKAKISLSEVK